METISKRKLSKCLSQEMNEIGFDRKRIRERIHASSRSSRAKDIATKRILATDDIEKIFIGSQSEGIGISYFNDIDILQINNGITCIKARRSYQNDRKLVFQMIQKKAPAGYTFLKLLYKDTDPHKFSKIKYSLVKKKGEKFLSSKLFMTKNDDVFMEGQGLISHNTRYGPPKGPSIPKYIKNDPMKPYLSHLNLPQENMDFVRAFPCDAEGNLKAWSERKRCSWPSKKIITHVMTLPVYVVPVGQKNSKNEDLQWRISFTIAETYLIQAFNNIQSKVLVLMKLIAKYILQPLCTDISSYVVKTVTLWMAEKIPQKKFRQKHLIARLKDALDYLKTSVESKYLPCYMIPKRNLFMNKLRQKQQWKKVLQKLDFLLQNGLKLIQKELFSKMGTKSHEVLSVMERIYNANYLDKMQTCINALYTTQQLANYFHTMFYISERWQMKAINILLNTVPYFFTYGLCGYFNPLSIDLSKEFAASAKVEAAAQRQVTMKDNLFAVSQPTQLKTLMIPINILIPLLCVITLGLYYLIKYGRFFLL